MNPFKLISLFCFFTATSIAAALTPHSITFPPEAPGYIKVIVKPPTAPISSAADVLFVVDNSGSMDPHQQNLAANVPTLTDTLSKFVGTVNVGVITTDMAAVTESGRLQGTPAVLQSGTANFVQELQRRLIPGVGGDGVKEAPLGAIMAALSEPLLSTHNAGFLRAHVPLNVVVISDEDDQSNFSEAIFANFLQTLKPAGDVSLFGIIPTSNTCGSDIPRRLTAVITQFQGEIHDICAADWGAKLRAIGGSIATQIMRTVRLPTEPVVSSIEVKFGSKTLTAGDAQDGWIYDRSKMSVVIGQNFDFKSQPLGTELEIKFIPKYWQN